MAARAPTLWSVFNTCDLAEAREFEVELVQPDPKEVENEVADFVQSYRQFRETNSRPDAATDANLGMAWWKRLEYLALADSRLKDIFCGRYRLSRRKWLIEEYFDCDRWTKTGHLVSTSLHRHY